MFIGIHFKSYERNGRKPLQKLYMSLWKRYDDKKGRAFQDDDSYILKFIRRTDMEWKFKNSDGKNKDKHLCMSRSRRGIARLLGMPT